LGHDVGQGRDRQRGKDPRAKQKPRRAHGLTSLSLLSVPLPQLRGDVRASNDRMAGH